MGDSSTSANCQPPGVKVSSVVAAGDSGRRKVLSFDREFAKNRAVDQSRPSETEGKSPPTTGSDEPPRELRHSTAHAGPTPKGGNNTDTGGERFGFCVA